MTGRRLEYRSVEDAPPEDSKVPERWARVRTGADSWAVVEWDAVRGYYETPVIEVTSSARGDRVSARLVRLLNGDSP